MSFGPTLLRLLSITQVLFTILMDFNHWHNSISEPPLGSEMLLCGCLWKFLGVLSIPRHFTGLNVLCWEALETEIHFRQSLEIRCNMFLVLVLFCSEKWNIYNDCLSYTPQTSEFCCNGCSIVFLCGTLFHQRSSNYEIGAQLRW